MYSNKNIYNRQITWLLCFLLVFFSGVKTSMLKARRTNTTIIKGKVIDALSKEALIDVPIVFPGTRNMPQGNPDLLQFPTLEDGQQLTYTLEDKPYMEASVGISNIFNFFRIDVVKRLTYPDHSNVSDIGIRGRFKFDF